MLLLIRRLDMGNNFLKKMVDAFSLKKYTGSDKEKLSLVELASTMFLATDFSLGKPELKQENFANVFSELIGVKNEENIPMNIMIATKTFELNEDTLLDFGKARIWYDTNKEKFNQAFLPVCEYAKVKYPELGLEESYKTR